MFGQAGSLALAGFFGAGKTTSMTFIWLALTTPVRLTVVRKENPAGIAAQVERMKCRSQRSCCSAELVAPPNGTLRQIDITPLTLPLEIRLAGQEFKKRKFWL